MNIDKRNLAFLFLGALIAISAEQLLWWDLIVSERTIHNDFWILISEDVKSFEEGSKLNVIYTTDASQARLVFNIWEVLLVIFVVALLILILKEKRNGRIQAH
ncbi:MAG: hypothetical protein V1944_01935 [Candidatus Aenigmatarchaeota archaeon]